MELAQPLKGGDPKTVLDAIRSEFPDVEDFERAFPSLCFSLATGVGKTRLMGAFIAYLHAQHGIRHFFVLAPNLTIYNKLVADFRPNTSKYVFQGISELAIEKPRIITVDNYEHASSATVQGQLLNGIEINIFNISKFNTKATDSRKIRRLSEFVGQSYFEYLASLDDLVLIMDEAHRYRADTSMKSIEELKPVLGLELTATPQIESGNKSVRFKNIIYDYPLVQAMRDGYVKEPAVATRENFTATSMSKEALERLKLKDGVRIHEAVKVELDVYAQENSVRRVKPFMLVIAEDTDHASALVNLIEDSQFFEGRYKGRVIQVHSGQRGAEKDENIERLLSVERPDEPTEIVVHVNMLKEGWDVTNLFTIVPLRAADSRTLVEQSIGRGLRLPYGRRTGVTAVDRLTIVAHDRFQAIIDEAQKGGYSFSTVTIGKDIEDTPNQTIVVAPVFETLLGISDLSSGSRPESAPSVASTDAMRAAPSFTRQEQAATAKLTLQAINTVVREQNIPGPNALQSELVQQQLVDEVTRHVNDGQLSMYPTLSRDELVFTVREATAVYVAHTITIPRVIVLPKGVVRAGFRDFTLDLSALHLQPVSQEILVRHLNSDTQEVIGASLGDVEEARLEDYVVRGLIDFDDVSYDEQADLLYGFAGQVVAHLRGRGDLRDDESIRNVLLVHQRQIATLIHAQMKSHTWEEASCYDAVVSQVCLVVRPQSFSAPATEIARPFDRPIDNKVDIRKMYFAGFKKCVYPAQKFDSDPERRFAVVIERDKVVTKWFKPGKGVFRIHYSADNEYEPDFVVETTTEKLLCEPKRADQMNDPVVLAKARAATTWCKHATTHELANNGKPWRYILIPHDAIADNMTVAGLVKNYEYRERT